MGLARNWTAFLVGCICVLLRPLDCRQQSQGPPFIKGVPTTVRDRENATVTIPCVVENLGAATLKWFKGEDLIVERTAVDTTPVASILDPRILVWPDNSLQVQNLQESDDGEYTCQVARLAPLKSIQRTNSIVVLFPPTVRLEPDLEEISVNLNDMVVIECITDGVPKPIVSWTSLGGARMDEDQMRVFSGVPKLDFQATSRHASGQFTCKANNGVEEPVEASVQLKILYPPEVTAVREWVHTGHGAKSELTCFVEAEPQAKVIWQRPDGTTYPPYSSSRVAVSVLENQHSLIIRSVRDTDLGLYSCIAQNSLGETRAEIELSGICDSVIIKEKLGMAMDLAYSLIWEVDCYSQVYDYTMRFKRAKDEEWYNLTIPSTSQNSYTALYSQVYSLSGLDPSTEYQVQVQARNKYGLGKPSKTFSFMTLGFGQTPTEIFNEEILEQVEEKEDIIKEIKVSVVKTSGFARSSSNNVGCSVVYATMALVALKMLMF